MKITKRMQQVFAEAPETMKRATVLKMEEMGLVKITDSWPIRAGMADRFIRSGQIVTYFEIIKPEDDNN